MEKITTDGLADAFPRIFDELYRYVRVRVMHVQDAEDIVSHTVETMLRRLHAFDTAQGSIEAWAIGIAKRHILHYWRDRRPQADLAEAEAVASTFEVAQANTSLDWARVAATLPESQRALLMLRYVDGYTSQEIASRTGRTSTSIRQQLSRLRKLLRGKHASL